MNNNNKSITGIEQGRAKFAYECVEEAMKIPFKEKVRDKILSGYKSYVKKIPMTIKTNGLASAFAFVLAKKKDDDEKTEYAYKLIYEQTTKWLTEKDPKKLIKLDTQKDLVGKLIKLNSPEYHAVTIEVLAFFNWLKRFADGLIEDKEDKPNEDNG